MPEISLWCLVFISGSVCGDHMRYQEELPRIWASASVGAVKSGQEILPKHPGVLLETLITFRTRSPKYMMWPSRPPRLVKFISHYPFPCGHPQHLPPHKAN